MGNGELRPQVSRVEAILRSPKPRTKKEVRSFLGLVGWYRLFIPDFATIAAPLTDALSKAGKNPEEWTEACERARCVLNRYYKALILTSASWYKWMPLTRGLVLYWPRDLLEQRNLWCS